MFQGKKAYLVHEGNQFITLYKHTPILLTSETFNSFLNLSPFSISQPSVVTLFHMSFNFSVISSLCASSGSLGDFLLAYGSHAQDWSLKGARKCLYALSYARDLVLVLYSWNRQCRE